MKIPVIMVSFCLLPVACNTKSTHQAKRAPSFILLQRFKQYKAAIDQHLVRDSGNLTVFVKLANNNDLVRVVKNNWPDSVEYTLNILRDKFGKIIFIAQMPFSESGDWDISYEHYFDEDGHTFLFCREESIFNEEVKGGVVRQTLNWYYNKSFRVIAETKTLTDVNNTPLKGSSDKFDFRNDEFEIYKNLHDCLAGYHMAEK